MLDHLTQVLDQELDTLDGDGGSLGDCGGLSGKQNNKQTTILGPTDCVNMISYLPLYAATGNRTHVSRLS